MNSRFGLHVRLYESLFDAVKKVGRLEHKIFQTVFMLQSRQVLQLSHEQIQGFVHFRRQHCEKLFLHGAYWSNLTDIYSRGFASLQKEVKLAEKLEFTHVVIHPGAFDTHMEPEQRVQSIIQALQILLSQSDRVIFLLENSPHKDRSFSADIAEFGKLFQSFSHPRVKMCIDTAHAYVAGYDITTPQKVNTFITYVANHVGIENIGLLHCNDTKKQLGSHLDEHAIPGYGNIGMQALYHMVHHSQLAHVPVIFEMPSLDESLEQDIIQQFTDMEII